MSNPKNEAAGEKATFDAEMAKMLNDYVMPGFTQIAERARWGLDRGGIDISVDEAFRKPTEQLEEAYTMTSRGTEAGIRQQVLQSGGMTGNSALTDAIRDANDKLMKQKNAAEIGLELQKGEAKLQSYYDLTDILNKEGGSLLDIARGNSANWGASINMRSGRNPWIGAGAGAASGALAGSVVPGVGTAVGAIAGAILGGVGGYFGSGG